MDGELSREAFQARLTGGAVYPAEIEIPTTVRVVYQDGSYEDIGGSLWITPIASLVADNPFPPTASLLAPPMPTITVTVTPEPGEPVTETVTVTPEPGGSSSENNGTGGLIAAVLAIISAVGGVGFWFLNQL